MDFKTVYDRSHHDLCLTYSLCEMLKIDCPPVLSKDYKKAKDKVIKYSSEGRYLEPVILQLFASAKTFPEMANLYSFGFRSLSQEKRFELILNMAKLAVTFEEKTIVFEVSTDTSILEKTTLVELITMGTFEDWFWVYAIREPICPSDIRQHALKNMARLLKEQNK